MNLVSSKQWRRRSEKLVRLAVRQSGRDTRGLQAHLFNDLSVMLIIVCGGKVGSEEAPAISTEINKMKIVPKRDNVLYMLKLTMAWQQLFANMEFALTEIISCSLYPRSQAHSQLPVSYTVQGVLQSTESSGGLETRLVPKWSPISHGLDSHNINL